MVGFFFHVPEIDIRDKKQSTGNFSVLACVLESAITRA